VVSQIDEIEVDKMNKIDISNLAQGTYFIRICTAENYSIEKSFVKIN
jgi:hypothetical protein